MKISVKLFLAFSILFTACAPKNYPASTPEENIPKAEDVIKFDSSFYDPNPTMQRK